MTSAGGLNSMTNWLACTGIHTPAALLHQDDRPDDHTAVYFSQRFHAFIVLYFFAWKNTNVPISYPLLLKIVFAAGALFVIWSVVSASSALNPQEGFYEIAKQMLFLTVLF